MTTPYLLRLIQDGAALDLNAGPYTTDFIPPDTQTTPMYAGGTSANRFGGASLAGERANNRSVPIRVRVKGTSDLMVSRAIAQFHQFAGRAGDPDHPVYLEYCLNSDISQRPLWGQGLWRRYELVHRDPAVLWSDFVTVDLRAKTAMVMNELVVRPYAVGLAQLVATATGGILPDQWGTPDGAERGLMIPEATPAAGNYFDNPVFGHPTFGNGWTAGTNIIATQNTDPNFCLPQTQSSALLQAIAATLNTYTESLTAANTHTYTLSAYVMRPDGAAVTSADVDLIYNSVALTTTYLNLGDGLYKLEGTFTGIASAKATGIRIKSGHSVYLLGSQMEDNAFSTPLAWGDLLGCAWASTAHASKSTRTAASCKVAVSDAVVRTGQGAITLTWIAPRAGTSYAGATYFLFNALTGGTGLQLYWDGTNDRWTWSDGTGFAVFATTFAAGQVIVFHATWGPTGGLILYINGVNVTSTGTYTPKALNANLFIGCDTAAGEQIDGTFADFRTFPHEMAAAEVAADYANTSRVSGATADVCQRVGAIPWLWTNAGDNALNTVDGTVSTVVKYNWAVAGGIPGSVAANTELKLTHSGFGGAFGDVYLSRSLWPYFYHGASKQPYYAEQNGTADSGNSSGDAYSTKSTDSTTPQTWVGVLDNYGYLLTQGREFYVFARLKDAGANLTIKANLRIQNSGTLAVSSDSSQPVAADTSMRLFKTRPLVVPRIRKVFNDDLASIIAQFELSALRSTGAGSNVSVDFVVLMPRPLTNLSYNGASTNTLIRALGRVAYLGSLVSDSPSNTFEDYVNYNGDTFELEPGGYNFIQNLQAAPGAIMPVDTTLTFSAVRITPRYSLL